MNQTVNQLNSKSVDQLPIHQSTNQPVNQFDEPSGWHVGFDKRELATELTRRMGWKYSSYGVEAIYNNPMNTDQIADVLGALDLRDEEIRRLRRLLPCPVNQSSNW